MKNVNYELSSKYVSAEQMPGALRGPHILCLHLCPCGSACSASNGRISEFRGVGSGISGPNLKTVLQEWFVRSLSLSCRVLSRKSTQTVPAVIASDQERARSCPEAAAFLLDTRHECCDLLLGGCLHSRNEGSGASRACQTGFDDRSPRCQQKPTANMNLKPSR